MKDDIMRFLTEFHRNGKLTKGINSTFIALIPKVDNPQKLNDYRPISLVGSLYKILAKVLANRLRQVVGSVVSEAQSAFIKDRQILDGILIANEVVDDARKLHKEFFLFKVDFEKAYDSVDWGTATASVLVNGSPTDEFPLERGLRQGDPLSPFLFLLAAEGLNVMMRALVQSNSFTGYSIGTVSPVVVSHLQFADDTLLLGVRSWANVRALWAVLMLFEVVSGLRVNFNKSMLVGVNIADSWLIEAASVLGCRVGTMTFMYLGLPIGGDPRRLSFWEPVVNRIRSRLVGWKSRFLSFGGRLVLLKLVLTSLPVYALSFFKAPSGIISSIESLLNNFFWGGCEDRRKISWISWKIVCLREEAGGLGVRQLREFNMALLGKWCWRLLVNKSGLWYRVLAARYGEEVGRLREGGRTGSAWWREIVRIRDEEGDVGERGWFAASIERRVGNGVDTFFWTDPWLGGVPLSVKYMRLFDLSLNKHRTVAEMRELGWAGGGQLGCGAVGYKWWWRHDPGGGYTVRGAYMLLTCTDIVAEDAPTDLIWHKQIMGSWVSRPFDRVSPYKGWMSRPLCHAFIPSSTRFSGGEVVIKGEISVGNRCCSWRTFRTLARIIKALKGLLCHDIDDLIDQTDVFSDFVEELRSASWRLTNVELRFLERVMFLKDGLIDDGAFIESVENEHHLHHELVSDLFDQTWRLKESMRVHEELMNLAFTEEEAVTHRMKHRELAHLEVKTKTLGESLKKINDDLATSKKYKRALKDMQTMALDDVPDV
ncbi:hypothetical protein TSUD_98260 [Trifolium subterraneum]|uniref:Reverse transcriptase domain-containing protein n=1 Tax=Trifolium subterraneum TaxID=3900 RepID=A0A2Z6N1S8_TRISU|nr:hypothetical protein TSUD_98260 [Trifolium subterraneum]